MSDRALLEMAAKAAGIVVIRSRLDDPLARDMLVANGHRNPHHETGPWNSLTNDGDALRLAVRLGISVAWHETLGYATVLHCPFGAGPVIRVEEYGDDPYAATRRAVTRAAAEVGKGMP
jgi:hypothetical protein